MLRVEGRRVNRSLCMGLVSHSCGGLDDGRIEVVVGMYGGQSQEGLVMCREMQEHFMGVK